jgi:hypothetical protein
MIGHADLFATLVVKPVVHVDVRLANAGWKTLSAARFIDSCTPLDENTRASAGPPLRQTPADLSNVRRLRASIMRVSLTDERE